MTSYIYLYSSALEWCAIVNTLTSINYGIYMMLSIYVTFVIYSII